MSRTFLTAVLAVLLMAVSSVAHADEGVRRDLRVLLVGPDPENLAADVSGVMENYERSDEVYANATASFAYGALIGLGIGRFRVRTPSMKSPVYFGNVLPRTLATE